MRVPWTTRCGGHGRKNGIEFYGREARKAGAARSAVPAAAAELAGRREGQRGMLLGATPGTPRGRRGNAGADLPRSYSAAAIGRETVPGGVSAALSAPGRTPANAFRSSFRPGEGFLAR